MVTQGDVAQERTTYDDVLGAGGHTLGDDEPAHEVADAQRQVALGLERKVVPILGRADPRPEGTRWPHRLGIEVEAHAVQGLHIRFDQLQLGRREDQVSGH